MPLVFLQQEPPGATRTQPVQAESLKQLVYTLLDDEDVHDYQLPWCGRFSSPFGLEFLRKTSQLTEGKTPEGTVLRYGSSLSEPELPISPESRERGLGYTAPSNFHHWVGYAAVEYRME